MPTASLTWRLVLVRPRNPLNIGAAARALANFGLQDLVVVAPYGPVWRETRSAVGAEEVLKSSRAFNTLEEALRDATWVVGTTSGQRRHLDLDLIPLTKFGAWLRRRRRRGKAALLFGSEKTGLSNEDLSYCHALVRIPTARECPSMNLGQAVAVCCYELSRAGLLAVRPVPVRVRRSEPARIQSIERAFARAARVMELAGSLRPKTRNAQLMKLRRVLLDLGLTNNQVRVLGEILAQVEWKLEHP